MEEGVPPVPQFTWEEAAERRIGIVEAKVDKLLDPETGIYPILQRIETQQTRSTNRLLFAALSVLLGLVANVALLLTTQVVHL